MSNEETNPVVDTPESYARMICQQAGIKATDGEIELLAADIEETCCEDELRDDWVTLDEVVREWLRRIGGFKNVRAYIDTLLAGVKR